MTNRDLNDSREQADDKGRDEPESRPGWKSKWVESTAPAADEPISPEEMQGHNLLGNPVRDGHGAPGERPDDVKYDGPRLNPPEVDEIPGEGGEETADG
jgi:hypothetical protein